MSRVVAFAFALLFTVTAFGQDVEALTKELGSLDLRTRSKAMMASLRVEALTWGRRYCFHMLWASMTGT